MLLLSAKCGQFVSAPAVSMSLHSSEVADVLQQRTSSTGRITGTKARRISERGRAELYEGDKKRLEADTTKRRSASERNSRKRSALWTCVTAKQMRAALELNDAISRKVSMQTDESINIGLGNVVGMASEFEAKVASKRSTIRKSTSRHRNRQPKCLLTFAQLPQFTWWVSRPISIPAWAR